MQGLQVVLAERVIAGQTVIVLQQSVIDGRTNGGTDCAACRCTDETADECTEQSTSDHSDRAGYRTYSGTCFSAADCPGDACCSACGRTDDATGLATVITGFDVPRGAARAQKRLCWDFFSVVMSWL